MALTGNLAKVQMIEELEALFRSSPERTFRILDVGVTGPNPLNFWETLFRFGNFELTGVDVDAESIEALKKGELPRQVIELDAVSGYDLAKRFGEQVFDVVVSTQVLEHMKYPERFLRAAFEVLRKDGALYLCYDSGDYDRGHSRLRELMKDIVVLLTGNERYHDKDIPTMEAERMLQEAGFRIEDRRQYHIHPLKRIHNHEIPEEKRDAFLAHWKRMEDWLNENGHAGEHRSRYMGTYFKAIKP